MKEPFFNPQVGVLIVGSLLWQDYLVTKDDTIRKEWRHNHLDIKSAIAVQVPIRYGRLSGGNIYTMTFANSVRSKPGAAWVIPFQTNPVTNLDQLLLEAIELSNAEGMKKRFIKIDGNNVPWSVLGILFNEKKIAAEQKQNLSDWWKAQLEADPNYKFYSAKTFKLGTEKPCILQNGQLNFPWINAVRDKDKAKLDAYDFLIATATLPTNGKYPSISKMVTNVSNDKVRRYFMNNNERGITTFQDTRVLKKINEPKKS